MIHPSVFNDFKLDLRRKHKNVPSRKMYVTGDSWCSVFYFGAPQPVNKSLGQCFADMHVRVRTERHTLTVLVMWTLVSPRLLSFFFFFN